ncbi:MAG: hypothetical protein H6707_17670 [Deltaproteobacteria bacterium]|nr:hypothetical protein [Deltaproteobacteria bacterium]
MKRVLIVAVCVVWSLGCGGQGPDDTEETGQTLGFSEPQPWTGEVPAPEYKTDLNKLPQVITNPRLQMAPQVDLSALQNPGVAPTTPIKPKAESKSDKGS